MKRRRQVNICDFTRNKLKKAWARDLKSRLEGSEKLLTWQEYLGVVAKKVDRFETELRRLGWHDEFGWKVADLGGKVDYWKQVLADLGGLKITPMDVADPTYD